jgi:two-component system, NarL family, response regulator DegU
VSEHKAIRVVIADDHTMLREGLRRSLAGQGLDVVADASDGSQAVALVEQHKPDAVLMDVTMPVLDGIDAAKRIQTNTPATKVIMLTMHSDPALAKRAREAGASAYLVKDCTTSDIISAIERAMEGATTFPPIDSPVADTTDGKPLITQREAEVLQLIANGRSTSEAAQELYVSVKTVKNHLGSAYAKLDTHDRTQAVLKAARLGIIKLNRP